MSSTVDRSADERLAERRGARVVHDLGVRTRSTDQPPIPSTPHALRVWISTFELRWAEHLTNAPKKHPAH